MKRIIATYRLQFRQGMNFQRASRLVPYLRRLGVSHLYASPIFAAVRDSTHGYDVVDHNHFDSALGGDEGFLQLSDTLRHHGVGLILDIVPNHMAASTENPWWASVLEWGEESPYADHFDIDWRAGPLTLPFLGANFAASLSKREFAISIRGDGRIILEYYGNGWPLHPHSWPFIFARIGEGRFAALGKAAAEARPDGSERLHDMARDVLQTSDLGDRIEAVSREAALISALHEVQPWRLLEWREGRRHLTYRRFFEITGLVGVRVESERVFADVHRTALSFVHDGRIDGLRIDHIDGLADPTGYLRRLRAAVGPDIPIFVEKILQVGESLCPDWPIEGTTGYEFISALADAFTDGSQSAALDRAWSIVRGERLDYAAECRAAKSEIVTSNFEGELTRLWEKATRLTDHLAPGLTDSGALRQALIAALSSFPVYRTYINAEGIAPIDGERLAAIKARLTAAEDYPRERRELDLLFRLLRLDVPDDLRPLALDFTIHFQQLTSPVMAKAIEDTVFYRFNRLIALNEVGGNPGAGSGDVAAFHAAMAQRAREELQGLSATATHDTKRGEDARARLYTISEAPEDWAEAVDRWRRMQAGMVNSVDGRPAPDPETEWMLYQALVGSLPIDRAAHGWLEALRDRFLSFLEKAMRESKRRTAWTKINEPYESAVLDYARRLLDPDNRGFLEDFIATALPFVTAGRFNSMAQTLIKLTAPGIPDIYNGSEGWDFSFVDPDNRRPIAFHHLASMLESESCCAAPPDDSMKQHLIVRALKVRRQYPELFTAGSYLPVAASGPHADHVLAFLRHHRDRAALIVVPRLVLHLLDGNNVIPPETWDRTQLGLGNNLEAATFTNGLSGEAVSGADLRHVSTAIATTPVGFFITA